MTQQTNVDVFESEVFKGHQWFDGITAERAHFLRKKRIADIIFWMGILGMIGIMFAHFFLGYIHEETTGTWLPPATGTLTLIALVFSVLRYGPRIQGDRNWVHREMADLAKLLDVSVEELCQMSRETARTLAHEKIIALAKKKLEYGDGMVMINYYNWPQEHKEVVRVAHEHHLENMDEDVTESLSGFRSFKLVDFESTNEVYAHARTLVQR